MEKFFKLKERGTSVRTEFVAVMTTFFAMVYILMVNANMSADPFGDGSLHLQNYWKTIKKELLDPENLIALNFIYSHSSYEA